MNHHKLRKIISLNGLLIVVVNHGLSHISREIVIFDDKITLKVEWYQKVCLSLMKKDQLCAVALMNRI